MPPDSDVRANVRVAHGDDIILVRLVTGRGEAVRLPGVAVYDRAGGTLRRIMTAARRPPRAGRRLGADRRHPVRRRQRPAAARPERCAGAATSIPTSSPWRRSIPTALNFWQLRDAIAALAAANRSTATLESNLWHKFAAPFSTLLMPLLAAIAAFGLARSGQLFMRAVLGMALGFAYFVADNFALAMGNLGAYPPILAAWGPFLLFLLVGEAVLIRTEE